MGEMTSIQLLNWASLFTERRPINIDEGLESLLVILQGTDEGGDITRRMRGGMGEHGRGCFRRRGL
jgi:hypothetical protein